MRTQEWAQEWARKLAQESGGSAPAGAAGALETATLAQAPDAGPLITGPAVILWTGFAGAAVIFFLVFALLLRGRIGQARSWAASKEQRAGAAMAAKQSKDAPDTDFFQPAGESAEITFDDDPRAPDARARAGDKAEADIVAEHNANIEEASRDAAMRAAPIRAKQGAPHPGETETMASPRNGPFSSLFGGDRRNDHRREDAAGAETPAHPSPLERHGAQDAMKPYSQPTDYFGDWPQGARLSDDEQRLQALEDAEKARDETEFAYAEAEQERRRFEADRSAEARREQAALERERALAEQAARLQTQTADLKRDVVQKLDDRFASLAERIEARLGQRASEADAPAVNAAAAVSALARDIDQRLAALAERLEARFAASGAHLAAGEAGPDADERLLAVSEMISRRMAEHREAMNAAMAAMSERIELVAGAPADMQALRDEIKTLKGALAGRGSGPNAPLVQLSDIVRNALPPTAYEMRAMLANNRRADCLIRLSHPPGPIAIDARFPTEAFDRLSAASREDEQAAANEFRRTALRHIVDIAERLIVPEETAESALMFIPSESLYATLHARFPDVVQDSYRARVWIVSPTTLMATLHTIRAVLRDAQARESADLINSEAQHVLAEVDALRRRVVALEDSFEKTRHDVRDVISSTDQVYRRAETITNTRRTLAEGALDRGSKRIPATPEDEDDDSDDARRDAEGSSTFPLR